MFLLGTLSFLVTPQDHLNLRISLTLRRTLLNPLNYATQEKYVMMRMIQTC